MLLLLHGAESNMGNNFRVSRTLQRIYESLGE